MCSSLFHPPFFPASELSCPNWLQHNQLSQLPEQVRNSTLRRLTFLIHRHMLLYGSDSLPHGSDSFPQDFRGKGLQMRRRSRTNGRLAAVRSAGLACLLTATTAFAAVAAIGPARPATGDSLDCIRYEEEYCCEQANGFNIGPCYSQGPDCTGIVLENGLVTAKKFATSGHDPDKTQISQGQGRCRYYPPICEGRTCWFILQETIHLCDDWLDPGDEHFDCD